MDRVCAALFFDRATRVCFHLPFIPSLMNPDEKEQCEHTYKPINHQWRNQYHIIGIGRDRPTALTRKAEGHKKAGNVNGIPGDTGQTGSLGCPYLCDR